MTSQLGGGWFWGLSGELDILLWGNQRSHIWSQGTWDWWDYDEWIDNQQNRGYGLRGSVKLEKKGDKVDLIIEPFIRYWKINESDLDWYHSAIEPTNSTLEAGLRITLGF